MPIHPQAQEFLNVRTAAGARPVNELTPDEARAQANALTPLLGPGEAVEQVRDSTVPGAQGDIPIRIYTPSGSGPFPVLVWFHGGGWVIGNLDTTDVTCRVLANGGGCVVVSVNYRHAPEHHLPAAPEDCYAATAWVAEHASELNATSRELAVGGSSAGGNLAAAVTLMARDRGGPKIVFQLLMVPVTDFNFETGSYKENAEGYGLTTQSMRWYWDHYLRMVADGAHPYASPLRAPDLHALPSAFVMTAELDPLHDEGVAYAERLRAAGVPVTHQCYAGMIHGYLGPDAPVDMGRELRAAFAKSDARKQEEQGMNATQLLQNHLGSAHWVFSMTCADVTEEVAHAGPFGTAGTVGSRMAHLVYDEDLLVHGLLQGKPPLASGAFEGKTGISDPQMNNSDEWAKKLRLNLAEFAEYQKAVFGATEAFAATLSESDLNRELDMSSMGMGKQNVGWAFGMLIIGHANSLAGEISTLKGVQGLKGYPF